MHCLLLPDRHALQVLSHVVRRLDVHEGFPVVCVQETPEVSLLERLGRLEYLLGLLETLEGRQGLVNGRLHKSGNPKVYGVGSGLTCGGLEMRGASSVIIAWGRVNIGVVSESHSALIIFTHGFFHHNICLRLNLMEFLKF